MADGLLIVSWLMLVVLCLILTTQWTIPFLMTYIQKKEAEKIAEELQQEYESGVKTQAGLLGVEAREKRQAEKLISELEFKMDLPTISAVAEMFDIDEKYIKALQSNKFFMEMFRGRIEPRIQELIQMYTGKVDEMLDNPGSKKSLTKYKEYGE